MAGNARLRKFAMSTPGFRTLAWRLVAGEDLDAAVAVARQLGERGITTTLNALGIHVGSEADARAGAGRAIEAVRRIQREAIDATVSVKLTAIGLEFDPELCRALLNDILSCASEAGVFVRIDMEEFANLEATLRLFAEARAAFGNETVGIVIQSYLRNPPYDLAGLIAEGTRIRIVKGGYQESSDVTYHTKSDIDAAFRRDVDRLLRSADYPAIATHDEATIDLVRAIRRDAGIAPDRFELQMLYGVRADLQETLVREGFRVRAYMPYGGTLLNWLGVAYHDVRLRIGSRLGR